MSSRERGGERKERKNILLQQTPECFCHSRNISESFRSCFSYILNGTIIKAFKTRYVFISIIILGI